MKTFKYSYSGEVDGIEVKAETVVIQADIDGEPYFKRYSVATMFKVGGLLLANHADDDSCGDEDYFARLQAEMVEGYVRSETKGSRFNFVVNEYLKSKVTI